MPPLALLFVLGGILLIRQVVVGRAGNTPEDIRDLSLALVHGDTAEVGSVLARRGENVPEAGSGEVASTASSGTSNSALLTEVIKLGTAAKGYRWGGIGPDYYDCSGLVWRAMRNLDIYKGLRFNTAVFGAIAKTQGWTAVDSPSSGDVVVWAGKHMGVSAGGDKMFSARSPSKGIAYSTISGDSSVLGSPKFYRISQGGN